MSYTVEKARRIWYSEEFGYLYRFLEISECPACGREWANAVEVLTSAHFPTRGTTPYQSYEIRCNHCKSVLPAPSPAIVATIGGVTYDCCGPDTERCGTCEEKNAEIRYRRLYNRYPYLLVWETVEEGGVMYHTEGAFTPEALEPLRAELERAGNRPVIFDQTHLFRVETV